MEASELECCLTVENLNSNGVVTKRRTFKSVTVVLGRNEFRSPNCKSLTSSQSSLGQTFPEGINHSQMVVTGREGYHQRV